MKIFYNLYKYKKTKKGNNINNIYKSSINVNKSSNVILKK